jgi:hypothetical protein
VASASALPAPGSAIAAAKRPLTPHDRPPSPTLSALVAEGVRLHEERSGQPIDEAHAWRQGLSAGEGLESRVRARALATRLGGELVAALRALHRLLRGIALLAMLLALVAGCAAAALVFAPTGDTTGQLNVFWALTSLLGLQSLMLLAWLLLALASGAGGGGGLLGQAVLQAVAGLARRLHRDEAYPLAAVAATGWLARSGGARWAAGLLTHLLWVAFGAGALLTSLWILAIRQYDFVWGTTLLGEESFVVLVAWLAGLPAALGLAVPDAALVSASRIGAEAVPEGRRAWSTLLLASLVLYGLLPRLLLAGLCRVQLGRRLRRGRLDLRAPGYARLAPRLMPASAALGVLDPAPAGDVPSPAGPVRQVPAGSQVLLVWLALPPERCARLARLADARVEVFGSADAREVQAALLAALPTLTPPPGLVAVVTSLLRTPDRHAINLLTALRSTSAAALWLVLTEADLAPAHGIDASSRVAAWRAAATAAAVDHLVVESAEGSHSDSLDAFFKALDAVDSEP